ncbi:MAG: Na+/H+ antiporter subunit D [Acidimicrobiales bacterium]|nr:Na+/H+ antiporter subunit D [Acidimicrobiales bacterium]MCB1016604.1 Na+/H+ antiporter subunit D [Acidimicrobiales bacterium]MCB9374151.1 Na+/H+ antiporter subunit D [Microthrixaceae bacterium]
MNLLLAGPVVLPLLGAALCIGAGRSRNAQRVIAVLTLTAVAVLSAVLLLRVDDEGTVAVQVGGWEAPVGITLVADRLAAIMLVLAVLMLLAVLVYAIGQPGAEEDHVGFHPVYLVLAAGVALAFLTGDLFNLFVAFEVLLMASYVLLTLGGRADQVRSGMTYVVISLLASALFLAALAFVYAATGTLNLADLSEKVAALPTGVRTGLALLLIVVFGIKSAIFPLFFWLPDSYPTAPSPVTAVFAGLLTKVGVYALLRSQTLLFPPDTRPGTLLLVVAALTMVVGVLGAVTQDDIKRILSFHIVSQIGYMVMGLGLFTVAGLAGAVIYIIHHIVVKTTLFLVAGLVEQRTGTGKLAELTGLRRLEPVLAVLFLLPALSLAGIPPFSGFVAKLALVEAGMGAEAYVVVAVSLAVSLLTLFSMSKIWSNTFWGPGPGTDSGRTLTAPRRALMVGSTGGLVALSLAIAVAAGPLYALSERAAADLMDTRGYVEEVLGR